MIGRHETQIDVDRLAGLIGGATDEGQLIFFYPRFLLRPQTRVLQNASHGVGGDERHPLIIFSDLVSDAPLAPTWVLLSHSGHALRDDRIGAVRFLGRGARKIQEPGIAFCCKARLPIIKRLPTDMRDLARICNIIGRLPGFEQEATLVGSGARKVRSFACHNCLLYLFSRTVTTVHHALA